MKKLTFILLICTLFVACRKKNLVLPASQIVSENGLVAYYPLDGHSKDLTRYANHGVTNAVSAFDRNGLASKSYLFNNSFFQSSKIPINVSKQYTFSFWIKMQSYADGMAIMELAKGEDTTKIPCNLNPQIWQFRDSMFLTTSSNIYNQIYIMSLKNIKYQAISNWANVTWTVSNGLTKMYVDGVLTITRQMPWPDLEGMNLTLGNAGNSCPGDYGMLNYHNQPSNCFIDEVKIYNRVLTDDEVLKLARQ